MHKVGAIVVRSFTFAQIQGVVWSAAESNYQRALAIVEGILDGKQEVPANCKGRRRF